MDRGKKPISKFIKDMNSGIYMDLKNIIREYALPCLPAKSLFRSMGVCRDWKNQISTPFFAHKQTNLFHAISGFFYQFRGDVPSFISLDMKAYGVPDPSLKFLPEEVDITCSSNGLVCCQGRTADKAYYICNPVTKQWKKLPKPNGNHGPDPAIVLIFEPSLLSFVAEYKLVCAFPSTDFDNGYEFEIYCSLKGTWEVSGEILFGDRALQPSSGVHVDGVVYWVTRNFRILTFDLMKERAQVIHSMKGSLGVMHGKLCIFSVNGRQLNASVLSNIHSNTMGTYGASAHSNKGMSSSGSGRLWKEKYSIPLPTEVIPTDRASVVYGGTDVVVLQAGTTMYSFDTKSNNSAVLSNAPEYNTKFIPYVNNLVYL